MIRRISAGSENPRSAHMQLFMYLTQQHAAASAQRYYVCAAAEHSGNSGKLGDRLTHQPTRRPRAWPCAVIAPSEGKVSVFTSGVPSAEWNERWPSSEPHCCQLSVHQQRFVTTMTSGLERPAPGCKYLPLTIEPDVVVAKVQQARPFPANCPCSRGHPVHRPSHLALIHSPAVAVPAPAVRVQQEHQGAAPIGRKQQQVTRRCLNMYTDTVAALPFDGPASDDFLPATPAHPVETAAKHTSFFSNTPCVYVLRP